MENIIIKRYVSEEHKKSIESILINEPDYLEIFSENAREQADHTYVALLDNSVAGYLSFSNFNKSVYTTIYVAENHRRKGVGTKLIQLADNVIMQKKQVELSMCSCLAEDRITLQFLYKNGYYINFSSYFMERNGAKLPFADIEVRQYQDKDYPIWHHISSNAFYHMRNKARIMPSYYSPANEQERASLLANKDNHFVMLKKGEVIATGSIDKNELDSVSVRDDLQHKGYGKSFISYLINTIIERGEKTVCLWVVDGNPAKQLYEKLGFNEVSKHCFMSRYYRADSRPSSPPAI